MRHWFFAWLACASLGLGCSSSDAKAKPSDAGAEAEASADDLIQGCATFADHTTEDGGVLNLLWDQSIAVSDDRCSTIKVGQTVIFGNGIGGPGDFVQHPLIAYEGDTPNPIENLNYQTGAVVFPAAGTFGYDCGTHPAMKGAIKVVP